MAEEARIPADLSGFFCVIPLQLSREVDGAALVCAEILRTWFLLIVSYGVQLLFLYEIAQIDESKKWEVHQELRVLNLVCVFVFIVQIFQEFHLCKDLFYVLVKCPVKHSDRPIYQQLLPRNCAHAPGQLSPRNQSNAPNSPSKGPKHGAILEVEMESPEQANKERMEFNLFGQMTSLMKKLHPGRNPEEIMTVWTLDDMTLGWKVTCVLIAAVPRFLIVLLCGYIGAIYIGRSESKEAMLLNTLAVLFVLDIDDSIYHVFTSGALKVHMENVKPVVLHVTNNERLLSFIFASFAFPVLAVTCSYAIVEMDRENELSVAWLGKLGIGHLYGHMGSPHED